MNDLFTYIYAYIYKNIMKIIIKKTFFSSRTLSYTKIHKLRLALSPLVNGKYHKCHRTFGAAVLRRRRRRLKVWIFGDLWCRIWLAVDVWMCTASILNLCAISLDRYVAVTRPVTYPSIMSTKRAKLLVAGVWVLSFVICFPPLVGLIHQPQQTPKVSQCVSHICAYMHKECYCVLYFIRTYTCANLCATDQTTTRQRVRRKKKLLFIIFIAFPMDMPVAL